MISKENSSELQTISSRAWISIKTKMTYFHCIKSNVNAGGYGYGVKRHFQQYFTYIVMASFIGGWNQNIRWKSPTCCKSLAGYELQINMKNMEERNSWKKENTQMLEGKHSPERMHTRPKHQLTTSYVHSNKQIIWLNQC